MRATLLGENVFHGCSIIGMINSIDELPKVRKYCKERYGIEFVEFNQSRIDGFYSYS